MCDEQRKVITASALMWVNLFVMYFTGSTRSFIPVDLTLCENHQVLTSWRLNVLKQFHTETQYSEMCTQPSLVAILA
jgi:hypothetical protein